MFYLNYKKKIEETLKLNPPDKKCKDGSKFWKGSNRIPHVLEFNDDFEIYYYYLEYFSFLLADSLGIPINIDLNYKKNFSKLIIISENEEIFQNNNNNLSKEKQNQIEKLKSEILNYHTKYINKLETNIIHEQIFEKDNDENHQIDFLHISSNLRALNFNIDCCSKDKVKFIAGKIVPSIPTTTSSIVGYISSQILTLIQTTEPKFLRQINIDLSTPFFLIHQPKKVYKNKDYIHPITKILTKAIPPFFTCWDCLEINGKENKTVNDVINYINNKYQVDICGLYTLNSINIIKDDSSYEMNFENAYFEAIGKKCEKNIQNIYFKVLADLINCDDHAIMPKFKYIIS